MAVHVNTPDWHLPKLRNPTKAHNARLRFVGASGVPSKDSDDTIWLTVQNIDTNFSLAGNYAQSYDRRDFYTHNFVQTVWNIQGQAQNQKRYIDITNFIRRAQLTAIQGGRLLEFSLFAHTPGPMLVRTHVKKDGKWVRPLVKKKIKRSIKGSRQQLRFIGYVQNMPHTAERWVVAPNYTFPFTVARALSGPFTDSPANTSRLKNVPDWSKLLQDANLIVDPDIQIEADKSPPRGSGDHDDVPGDGEYVSGGEFDDLPGPGTGVDDWLTP